MITTAYGEQFGSMLSALKSLAEEMGAADRIEEEKNRIYGQMDRWLPEAEARAMQDAQEYWQSVPDRQTRPDEEFMALYEGLLSERHRNLEMKISSEIAKLDKKLPAEIGITKAIEQLTRDWYISAAAMNYVAEAVEAMPKPEFDVNTQDAIRRGFTATDSKSAKSAAEQAKKLREEEQAKAREQEALRRQAQLRAEREELEAEIEKQKAPQKRLEQIKKELTGKKTEQPELMEVSQ